MLRALDVGELEDPPPSVQELRDLMTQESNYRGVLDISEDSKRNLKSHLPVCSRETLDLTRNWLSIIPALLRGRDTYQKR